MCRNTHHQKYNRSRVEAAQQQQSRLQQPVMIKEESQSNAEPDPLLSAPVDADGATSALSARCSTEDLKEDHMAVAHFPITDKAIRVTRAKRGH